MLKNADREADFFFMSGYDVNGIAPGFYLKKHTRVKNSLNGTQQIDWIGNMLNSFADQTEQPQGACARVYAPALATRRERYRCDKSRAAISHRASATYDWSAKSGAVRELARLAREFPFRLHLRVVD